MRLYLEVARLSFARHITYRAATLAGMLANIFFGIVRSFLFLAVFAPGEVQNGWTERDAIAYVWIAQALLMPVWLWGDWDIALSIRSGDVVTDLSRPYDYYAYWLSQDGGRALFHLLSRMVPTLGIGMLLFDVRLSTAPGRWLLFALSLALAIWVSFGMRFLANISAFWLMDYRGMGALLMFANNFFSGLLVPIALWPDSLARIAYLLPFAALIQTPVDVLLGVNSTGELATALGLQLLWGVALLLAGRLVLSAAVRRVVVQGG